MVEPAQSEQPKLKKRSRRDWDYDEKIAAINALEANRGNLVLTAEQTGVPKSTLWMWANIHKAGKLIPTTAPQPDAELVAEANAKFQRDLASKLESLVHKLLDSAPEKIERANLRDTMVAVGIGIEKMKLLRGEPTEITRREESVKSLTDEQLADVLALARRVATELAPRPVPLDTDNVTETEGGEQRADESGTGTRPGEFGDAPAPGAVGSAVVGEGVRETAGGEGS
jgi:transposase-like protein